MSNDIVLRAGKIQMTPCAYCQTNFLPKRRFIQKYCNESCRTMACRERMKGISGELQHKAKSTSITDLNNSLVHLFSETTNALQFMNLRLNELMFAVDQIKYSQSPEIIKDIDRKISDWHSKGMSNVPEQLNAIKLDLFKIQLSADGILKKQNTQQLIIIIGALFGPILGKKIWDSIEGLVTDKKKVPLEDRINAILEAINKMDKKQ